jgi:cell division protein FtsB
MKERIARLACAIAFLLVATYAAVTLAGPKGLSSLYAKEREIQAVEKQNAEIAKDIDREKKKVDQIRANPDAQERVVEERLNLVRPGDKVFMLPDAKKK